MKKQQQLTGKQVHSKVIRRLRSSDKLNHLERFAMFMGKTQLIEMALKNLLTTKYDYTEEQIERWTLGRLVKELKTIGLRRDFIALLEELVHYRNHIAHDLLLDYALMQHLGQSKAAHRLSLKPLERGLYMVEQTIVVYDFLATNKFL
jgi:hypothetical protein